MTKETIRTEWSTNLKVGGIQNSLMQNCMLSCEVRQERNVWDEVMIVRVKNLNALKDLHATLESIYTEHIVLRRHFKRRV